MTQKRIIATARTARHYCSWCKQPTRHTVTTTADSVRYRCNTCDHETPAKPRAFGQIVGGR